MDDEIAVTSKIAADVKLGRDVKIYDFVNLYGCEIGDSTKIGAFVEIQKGAKIGRSCKISSHTFICKGVTIEDNVFIGHNVTFINDLYPRAVREDGRKIEVIEALRYPDGSVSIQGHPEEGTAAHVFYNFLKRRTPLVV